MQVLLYRTAQCIGNYVVYFSCRHNKSPIRQFFTVSRNILHTNIKKLKAFTDVKILTFLEKNGDDDDHKMDP